MNITKGNAIEDGSEFRFWFVGPVSSWCRDNGIPFDRKKFGLRNTDDIEVKWGIYRKGDARTDWASCSEMTGMSILLRGDCIFSFRTIHDHNQIEEVRVMKEGDYIIWQENIEHKWKMLDDSVFLTLRWKQRSPV